MSHTLLLADDSVTIQRVIELTFADEDFLVIAVSSGDEAIAVLNRTPPDIVLADVGMPEPSGYDIARHIRDTPQLAHIPVVLLTGAFEPVDQSKADQVGCDGVLAKPFEPQLVIGRVKELLAKPKQIAAARAPSSAEPQTPWSSPAAALGSPGQFGKAAGSTDYFDRLDEAFANLAAPAPATAAAPSVGGGPDWFGPAGQVANALPSADTWEIFPSQSSPDSPLPHETPGAGFDRATPEPPFGNAPATGVEPPPQSPPPPLQSLPPLADAFAALLAAERNAPVPPAAPTWPAAPAEATITPGLVEEVTRRVLENLSDRVVRETVGEIVSSVAERLVREEIERIRGNIK